MKHLNLKIGRNRGFSLTEVLIVMALLSAFTLMAMNVSGPWLGFRASMEQDQHLSELRTAVETWYEGNSFGAEAQPAGRFGTFTTSTVAADRSCNNQAAAFSTLGALLSTSGDKASIDAYKNNYCVFTRGDTRVIDGVALPFRTIAMVSGGADGRLDAGTALNASGELVLGGDDRGFVFSGWQSQQRKFLETQNRLSRIAAMYEMHFTARYLANSTRNLATYYFSGWDDTAGSINPVSSTAGNWASAQSVLSPIGVGPDLYTTPWETRNTVEVGNYNEVQGSVQVRSPVTSGAGQLPYTALLRAEVPSATPGSATGTFIVRVVVGGY